jgi:hypothetical protein
MVLVYQWVCRSELLSIVIVFLLATAVFRLRFMLFVYGSGFYPSAFLLYKTCQIKLKLMIFVTEFRVFHKQNYHNLPQQKLKNNTILDLLEIISDNTDRKF